MKNTQRFRLGRVILWLVLAFLLGTAASTFALRWLHDILYTPLAMLAVAIALAWALHLFPGTRETVAVVLSTIGLALATPYMTVGLMFAACLLENQFGGHCVFL